MCIICTMYTYVDAPCTLFVVAIFGASTRMNDIAKNILQMGALFFNCDIVLFCVNLKAFIVVLQMQ